MKETPKEYVARILAKVEAKAKGQSPLKVQAATAKKLAQLVKGLPAGKLRKRPEPDKWSIAEILAHIGDTEIAVGWRLRSVLAWPGKPIQGFEQGKGGAGGRHERD